MTVHLEVDSDLMQEALALGEHHTQKDVVQEALEEYIQRRKQAKIIELFGSIEYEEDYDYKQQRQQS